MSETTHRIVFGGVTFHPLMSGALYAPELSTLLVADLHLEQGTSLARRGLYVPPFDTVATLLQLETVVYETKPHKLIFLGDSFHDDKAQVLLEPAHAMRLNQLTSERDTVWLSGNHDPSVRQSTEEYVLGPITLRHIPKLNHSGFEIAGHLHPGASLVQRGVHLRGKCFVADHHRMILPAFGSYTGALDLSNKAFDGLFEKKTARTWFIGRAAIHSFPLKRVM